MYKQSLLLLNKRLGETIEYEQYFIPELQMRINIYKYLGKTTGIYFAGEIMKRVQWCFVLVVIQRKCSVMYI